MDALTPRQRDVLRLMTEGMTIPQIAYALFISVSTVKGHIHAIYQTLGVSGLGNPGWRAVAIAMQSTLISGQYPHERQ